MFVHVNLTRINQTRINISENIPSNRSAKNITKYDNDNDRKYYVTASQV